MNEKYYIKLTNKKSSIYSSHTGQEIKSFNFELKGLSPDGNYYCVEERDPDKGIYVKILNFVTNEDLIRLLFGQGKLISLAFSQNSNYIVLCGYHHPLRGKILIYNINTGKLINSFIFNKPMSKIEEVEFSPNGRFLVATGGGEPLLHFYVKENRE